MKTQVIKCKNFLEGNMETRGLSALKQLIRTIILENSRKDLQEFKQLPQSNKEKQLQAQLVQAKTADKQKAIKAALVELEAEERALRISKGEEPYHRRHGKAERSADMKFLKKMPLNLQNEYALSDAINTYASEDNPITVIIGSLVFEDVTGADRAGGSGGKSDVDIYTDDGEAHGVSIKMPSADYWESAESTLGPLVGPVVKYLLSKKDPETRIVKKGASYIMKSNGKPISRLYFKLPLDIAQAAVFGPSGNSVEAVIEYEFYKGAATWNPKEKQLTIGSDGMKVYQTLRDIPEDSYPVGAIRVGETSSKNEDPNQRRGFTYDGTTYAGLRLVIPRQGFAKQGASIAISL